MATRRRRKMALAVFTSFESRTTEAAINFRVALDSASEALATASTVKEIKQVREKANTIKTLAKRTKAGLEWVNGSAELKLRAERKVGALLAEMRLRGGDRRSSHGNDRPRLADLGISHSQSMRWQLEATLSEDDFEDFLKKEREKKVEITSTSLRKFASKKAADKVISGVAPVRRAKSASSPPPPTESTLDCGSDETREELAYILRDLAGHNSVIQSLLGHLDESVRDAATTRMLYRYMSEIGECIDQVTLVLPTLIKGATQDDSKRES